MINHFLGSFSDQTMLFWLSWWRTNYGEFLGGTKYYSPLYGAPFGLDISYFPSQRILWEVFYFLNNFFGNILSYNMLLCLGILLTVFFTYRFCRGFFSQAVSLFISLNLILSSYVFFKISNHIDLIQIWVFPLFLAVLFKLKNKRKQKDFLFLGIGLSAIFLISNYYGFFLLLFSLLFSFLDLVNSKDKKVVLYDWAMFFLGFGISIFVTLFPYIKSIYFSSKGVGEVSFYNIQRPLEDFFIFSSRPWYFLFPSTKNPLFGFLTQGIIYKLQSTRYFIFNNYFPEEHGGSFLGWLNIVLFLFSLYIFFKKRISSQKSKIFLGGLFIISVLFLFTLPPFFTVSGMRIYTPNFFIYKLFPMFRVMSRLSILILFLILFLGGFGLSFIQTKLSPAVFTILVSIICFFNFSQMYIPLSITSVSSTPSVFSYIKENTDAQDILAVYPYNSSNEVLFWMKEHHRGLINPRDFKTESFNSEFFTKRIPTEEGLVDAVNLGVDYILVHKDSSEVDTTFFMFNKLIALEKEFSDYYLFRVIEKNL